MFRRNVGSIDAVARLLVAAVMIAGTVIGPATPWGWLGLIPLVTGLAGTCPLYTLFGLRTAARPAALAV